jgi:hypothetical protein
MNRSAREDRQSIARNEMRVLKAGKVSNGRPARVDADD